MQDLIKYLNTLWTNAISPTIKKSLEKSKENADRIEKAIKDKEVVRDFTLKNPKDIADPIVKAQKETTEAVKGIVINEVDIEPIKEGIENFISALEAKEMTVNVGKTEIDIKSVVLAIENLEKNLYKMKPEQVSDYTEMFLEMIEIMQRPKNDKHEKMMCALMEKMSKTEDLMILAEWLKVIAEKENAPFKFTKEGRLKVEVDRVSLASGITSSSSSGDSNPLAAYQTIDAEEASATVSYVGKAKTDGTYLIYKIDSGAKRAANIGNNPSYTTYATAWSARASLSYDYIFNLNL